MIYQNKSKQIKTNQNKSKQIKTNQNNMEALPIVPFGKYKGQPITTLLHDTSYLEFIKQQEWLKKHPIIYNICVNQTITTNNENTKTPEHNKLQNLFLQKANLVKFIKTVYRKKGFKYMNNISYPYAKAEFEGIYNWDIIISDISYKKLQCTCTQKQIEDDDFTCECKYENDDDYEYSLSNIYIEIKSLLGDDYPCVLRKMKTQKELTANSLCENKNEMLQNAGYIKGKDYAYNYGHGFPEVKKAVDYVDKNYREFIGDYILLLQHYDSMNTSKDELIQIFRQSGIQVFFFHEVFTNIPLLSIPTENIELVEAKRKIKELEAEIVSLKSQKQAKTIKDYFMPSSERLTPMP